MNTQCTSQWDGFRHFGLPIRQEEGSCVFYNNWSGEELEGNDEIGTDGESGTVARMFLSADADRRLYQPGLNPGVSSAVVYCSTLLVGRNTEEKR
jgi:hypothetical protein